MEEKQRVKLLESHKILLQERDQGIAAANQILQLRINEFRDVIILITQKLGIPKEDIGKWRITEDREAIEKIEDGNKSGGG